MIEQTNEKIEEADAERKKQADLIADLEAQLAARSCCARMRAPETYQSRSEYRLSSLSVFWRRRAPPARALAAGADVQRPGSCEQLNRLSSIDRRAAEFAK